MRRASNGDAYFTAIAHFMAALPLPLPLPLPQPSTTRWTTGEHDVRSAWRGLVQTRQEHLLTGN